MAAPDTSIPSDELEPRNEPTVGEYEDDPEEEPITTLDLHDGTIKLTKSEVERLMKIPYYQALLGDRWNNNGPESGIITSSLSVSAVQYSLGQITHAEMLGQVVGRAYGEIKQELDLIGLPTPKVDFQLKKYPWGLFPVVRHFEIQPVTEDIPVIHPVEAYTKMFLWNVSVSMTDLDRLRTQPNFSEYVALFWVQKSEAFLQTTFEPETTARIREYPGIFRTTTKEAVKLMSSFPSDLDPSWISFYEQSFPLSIDTFIEEKFKQPATFQHLSAILRVRPSLLLECLKRSGHNRGAPIEDLERLLTVANPTTCPFTLLELQGLHETIQRYCVEWFTKKKILLDEPSNYLEYLLQAPFSEVAAAAMGLVFDKNSSLSCEILVTTKNYQKIIPVLKKRPQIRIKLEDAMYRQSMGLKDYKRLIKRDPNLAFGVSTFSLRDEALDILIKYGAHRKSENVFIGDTRIAKKMFLESRKAGMPAHPKYIEYFIENKCWDALGEGGSMETLVKLELYKDPKYAFTETPEMAKTMFRLSRDAGVTVNDKYLEYFLRQKCWDMLDEMEPLYRNHKDRDRIMQYILQLDNELATSRFIEWEISMSL